MSERAGFLGVSTAPATVIVTRHPALLAYLQEIGAAPEGTPVIEHATPADVAGKRVIGVLPHRLSALCASVVEIPLDLPPELRGVELTLDQVRQYAGEPVEYVVRLGSELAHPCIEALAAAQGLRHDREDWYAAPMERLVAAIRAPKSDIT